MKVGFLTSHRGQKQFEKEYRAIIDTLQKKGHEVLHSMDTTIDSLESLSYADREEIFLQFFKELETCELIFVENSLQSTQLGWGLGYLRDKGKPIIVLSLKEAPNDIHVKGQIFSNVENMMAYEYTYETIGETIQTAIDFMEPKLDKRFTIIFPAELMAKVEEEAKKRHLPKAVYIRQLIEKDFQKQTI